MFSSPYRGGHAGAGVLAGARLGRQSGRQGGDAGPRFALLLLKYRRLLGSLDAPDFGPFRLLLISLAGWLNPQQQDVSDDLQEENRVNREQLGDRRLRLKDDQSRQRLGGILNYYYRQAA